MKDREMIQLKNQDIKDLRLEWFKENKGICPILGKETKFEDTSLDHWHALKSEGPTQEGKGCCRGTISKIANSWEGKVTNAFTRYGLAKEISIVDALRNLADYIESNKTHSEILYIHPTEKIKEPTVSKSNYNKLKKAFELVKKTKFPEYPKSKKLNIKLKKLFEEFNISPFN